MKRTVALLAVALLVGPLTAWARAAERGPGAQEDQASQPKTPWTDEEYREFYEASSAQDLNKKHAFVNKYSRGALTPLVLRSLAFLYLQSQNLPKAFEAGDAYFNSTNEHYGEAFKVAFGPLYEKAGASLPQKPSGDFELLINLVVAANQAARSKNTSYDRQALKYTEMASALMAAGGIPPTMRPEQWRGNENQFEATLLQTRGLLSFNRVNFRVTDETLADLKAEGIDDDSLSQLSGMVGQQFNSEDSLNSAVQQAVGAEQATRLKPSMLKYAVDRRPYYQATDYLRRAGELAPMDPVTFYLMGDAMRLGKYADARDQVERTQRLYNEATQQLEGLEQQVNDINEELARLSKQPDTVKKKERVDELTTEGEQLNEKGKELSESLDSLTAQNDSQVEQVNQVTDEMIRVYAKTVALSEKVPQLQKTARDHLERYYKYRHQNTLDGLQELVQRMKTELP